MSKKILCVDDDPNILQGFKRALRREFEIETAISGAAALALIESGAEFAVVVSDMRMPVLDGVEFLRRVKRIAPDTVRIMLTGNADQQTAIDAVNEGSIFRFLTKPCEPELLARALSAGIEHHRLLKAEKQLLEQTLNKSLQVLVDILSLVNPTAFNRSNRVKKLAAEIAASLQVKKIWEIEFAAMLSQIGCVTVPEEILQKIATGETLTEKETAAYHHHPSIARDLIARIPRMETVAEIVARQNNLADDELSIELPSDIAENVRRGARILKVVFDYDKLLQAGHLPHGAYRELFERVGWYDRAVLDALKKIIESHDHEYVTLETFVADLKPGMILNGPLYSTRDALLLSGGQEITMSLILRLKNFVETGFIKPKITVSVPVAARVEELVA